VICDLSEFLDDTEVITAVVSADISLGTTGWSLSPYPPPGAPPPYDPTPLLFHSYTLQTSNRTLIVFVNYGTPGNVYTLTFVLSGTSGQHYTFEIGVQVSGTPPVQGYVALPVPPTQGAWALPLAGGVMEGPLYLYEDPQYPTEAATKAYVDHIKGVTGGPFLSLTGGVLTGPLELAADPVVALGAATKSYVDAHIASIPPANTYVSDIPPPSPLPGQFWFDVVDTQLYVWYVDPTSAQWVVANNFGLSGTYLPLTGGSLTGALVLPLGTMGAPSLAFGAVDGTGVSRSGTTLLFGVQNTASLALMSGGAAQFYSTLNMLNNKILQLADATAAQDALNMRTGDARYAPTTGGSYLPLAGVTPMTGPLNYTATGGTTARSAQDRWADEVNALDYGLVADGVTDASVAIQAALNTGKNVYIPAGQYLLNHAITVGQTTIAQRLRGDGHQSWLYIDQRFDPTEITGVVKLQGREQFAPVIQDLRIAFGQPSDLASRATMKTIAAGGTSTTGGTGIQYPPAIYFGLSNRFKLSRIRIENAWDGVIQGNSPDSSGGWWMADIEISCYDKGLSSGTMLDFGHIQGWHHWNFGQTTSQQNVAWDGNTIAMYLGDGSPVNGSVVNCTNVNIFRGRIEIDGSAGATHFANLMMDGDSSTINHHNSDHTLISNCYFSCPTTGPASGLATLNMLGGNMWISGMRLGHGAQPAIRQSGAGTYLSIRGSKLFTPVANSPPIVHTAGALHVIDTTFQLNVGAAWTVAPVQSWQNLTFIGNGISTTSIGDVGLLSITNDNASNVVLGNYLGNWKPFIPPGSLGNYGEDDPTLTVGKNTAGSASITVGNNTAAGNQHLYLNSAPGRFRDVRFQTGGLDRWTIVTEATAESGGNAGSNFIIQNWNDAGAGIGTPVSIARSSGIVTLANGLVVTAGGATITAGGLTVSAGTTQFNAGVQIGTDTTSGPLALTINEAAGNNRIIQFRSASVNRWQITCDPTAEGGSNAGSNFNVIRYSDTGTNLGTPLSINRAAGGVTVDQLNVASAAGPNIRSGTGAATGTQPSGSLWLRTDGAVGTRIYVSAGAGTWNAIAGV